MTYVQTEAGRLVKHSIISLAEPLPEGRFVAGLLQTLDVAQLGIHFQWAIFWDTDGNYYHLGGDRASFPWPEEGWLPGAAQNAVNELESMLVWIEGEQLQQDLAAIRAWCEAPEPELQPFDSPFHATHPRPVADQMAAKTDLCIRLTQFVEQQDSVAVAAEMLD
ncbi:MAG: hypothetical protein OIF57_06665 [Marinobacterium sp.]|nr:hypothetical protein [Marinobacterium sp.]